MKKLVFAPLFLISLAFLCYQTNIFLNSTDSLFSLNLEAFLSPIILSLVILLTALLFAIFATLAQDWKIYGITLVIAAILPFIFFPLSLGIFMATGIVIGLSAVYGITLNKLKTYLNFQPSVLLSPSIKSLSTILVLVISVMYFQSMSAIISQKSFQIPDSLIDTITKLSFETTENTTTSLPVPKLSKDEIAMLKQNPKLLTDRGLDPSILTQLENPQAADSPSSQDLMKAAIKTQFNALVQPYQSFIAPTLAILVFFTLTSFVSLLSIFLPALLWITFSFLRSTGFIKFQTEMREVKKLVV